MMKLTLWRASAFFALPLSLALIAGCGSSGNSSPQTRLRILNAAINNNGAGLPVDVSYGGRQVAANLAYDSITQASQTVSAAANTTMTANVVNSSTQFASQSLSLPQGVDVIALITGVQGSTTGPEVPQITHFTTDLSAPTVSNQVRLYFVNASPFSTGATTTFHYSLDNGAITDVKNVAFPGESSGTPVAITGAGQAAFTADVGTQTVAAVNTTLQKGKTYLVLLTGNSTVSATPALGLNVVQLN